MIHVVLVMHAPLGAAFASCAEHVFQKQTRLTVFDVAPDAVPDACVQKLAVLLHQAGPEGVLILNDVVGATPFNIARQALALARSQGISGSLVTGANLCMVLKALTDQHASPEALAEEVRIRALRGITISNDPA